MLGRWSPKWQQVQKNYLLSIKSKRSSSRWCTAIIYKLMTVVWDIWQYRNSLVHADDGPLRMEANLSINNSIKAQFFIGGGDLLVVDQFLFEDYSLEGLLKSDMPTKLM